MNDVHDKYFKGDEKLNFQIGDIQVKKNYFLKEPKDKGCYIKHKRVKFFIIIRKQTTKTILDLKL